MNRVWNTVVAILQLIRVGNVIMIMSAVYLGAYLAAGSALDFSAELLLSCALATGLVAASANAMNDLLDVSSDRQNHANRPLVTSRISIKSGIRIAAGLFAVSILVAIQLSPAHQLLFGLASLVLITYNVWLSRLPVIGNLSIAFVVALSVPFGALAFGLTPTVWIAALFAFLTTFAREVSKDIEDVRGDSSMGERSIPVIFGVQKSRFLVRSVSLIVVVASVVPFLFFSFGGLYLLMMSVTNLFLVLPISTPRDASGEARIASSTLKWAMMCGMVALALSETIPLSHTP